VAAGVAQHGLLFGFAAWLRAAARQSSAGACGGAGPPEAWDRLT
jgi:hypothetical protein